MQKNYPFLGSRTNPGFPFWMWSFQTMAEQPKSIWSDTNLSDLEMKKLMRKKIVYSKGDWKMNWILRLWLQGPVLLKITLRCFISTHRYVFWFYLKFGWFQIHIKSRHLSTFLYHVKDGIAEPTKSPFNNKNNNRRNGRFWSQSVQIPGNDKAATSTNRAAIPSNGLV